MSSNLLYFTALAKMLLTVLLLFDKVSFGSPKTGNKHNSVKMFVLLLLKKYFYNKILLNFFVSMTG